MRTSIETNKTKSSTPTYTHRKRETQKQRKERIEGKVKISKKIGWKLPKFDVQEAQQITISNNFKETHTQNQTFLKPRQRKNLETSKSDLCEYKRASIRITADFSSEITEAKRQCEDIFKEFKD